MKFNIWLMLCCSLFFAGCATKPPKDINNICSIFDEKRRWYKKAKKAAKRWNGDVPQIMAFMHQESSFDGKAKPKRRKLLWLIPWTRLSSARGYAQAKKEVWHEYIKSSKNRGADRDNFYDAADFIAWYNYHSQKQLGIAKRDHFKLYLAYHEGRGGYKRGTYYKKAWLRKIAHKVHSRAVAYERQLKKCK